MPNLNSNTPSKIFYTSIDSEILHFVRITTDLINMVTDNNLAGTDKKVSFSRIILLLKQILWKHFKVFHKFSDMSVEFIKLFSLLLFLQM